MLHALLLASALSLGLGGDLSHGLGEGLAAVEASVRWEPRGWRLSADWSSADKVTPTARGGWLAGAALDRQGRHLIVGLAYRHRVGEAEPGRAAWHKETVWIRAGLRTVTATGVEARLLADSALTSRDRQSSVRAAFTLPLASRLSLEPEARVLLYDQGAYQANRRLGYVASLRLLLRFGRVQTNPPARSLVHELGAPLPPGGRLDGR